MARNRQEKSILGIICSIMPLLFLYLWMTGTPMLKLALYFVLAVVLIMGTAYASGFVRRKKAMSSGIDLIDKMRGDALKRFLLSHFQKLGYTGEFTPENESFGADLILEKESLRIAIQVNCGSKKNGVEAVRKITAAKAHYGAQEARIISNGFFTDAAVKLAGSSDIQLWDRDQLSEYMRGQNGRQQILSFNSQQ